MCCVSGIFAGENHIERASWMERWQGKGGGRARRVSCSCKDSETREIPHFERFTSFKEKQSLVLKFNFFLREGVESTVRESSIFAG